MLGFALARSFAVPLVLRSSWTCHCFVWAPVPVCFLPVHCFPLVSLPLPAGCTVHSVCAEEDAGVVGLVIERAPGISGLVAEYIVAVDVTRGRFPADACMVLGTIRRCSEFGPGETWSVISPMRHAAQSLLGRHDLAQAYCIIHPRASSQWTSLLWLSAHKACR